jgi:hypothetical protein
MLATVSRLRALTVMRRIGGRSGARAIMALSATLSETSCSRCCERGTSKVEPALTSMRGGMRLMSRRSFSLMPSRLAASPGRMVLGTTQAVQVARAPLWRDRLCMKLLALS